MEEEEAAKETKEEPAGGPWKTRTVAKGKLSAVLNDAQLNRLRTEIALGIITESSALTFMEAIHWCDGVKSQIMLRGGSEKPSTEDSLEIWLQSGSRLRRSWGRESFILFCK